MTQALENYIKQIDFPLLKMTVCYPLKGNQILLGKKIKVGGLGEGNYIGIGGKLEEGESFEDCAKREVLEEVGLKLDEVENMGTAYFYFPAKENKEKWNMETQIYTSRKWLGEPSQTDEMIPEWFGLDKIPFDKMWADNKLWIPLILEGKKVEVHVMYTDDNKTIKEYSIKFLD